MNIRFWIPILVGMGGISLCSRSEAESPDRAVEPIQIKNASVQVTVDPGLGGRVTSLTFAETELLRQTRSADEFGYGSTVWNSPQSDWNWPPLATFDSQPYTVVDQSARRVSVRSVVDPKTQLQLTKSVEIEDPSSRLKMTYRWANHGSQAISVSAWENSRIEHQGIVQYSSDSVTRLSKPDEPAKMHNDSAMTTIRLNPQTPNSQKLFVTPRDQSKPFELVYQVGSITWTKSIESFDPALVAPGEAPVEIYFGTESGFTELEMQGPYRTIGPGESFDTVIHWTLTRS